QVVAVVKGPSAVHGEHSVAVAVVGEADLGAGRANQLDQGPGMSRAAALVDVAAIRLRRDQLQVGAHDPEDHRSGTVGGAVRTVEGDPDAAEIEREGGPELADVVVEGPLELPHAPDLFPRR